ncbi:isoleucine--tRNA ligase [Candidatus Parvarchaeota archaeon]|uniref:Isoleucine--tRNA ligase n=1 Tax=Candidatus Acidifodinimicrobium mancum TaxID=2898728 RepID=A0A8T3UT34_9ARCH|nr:isoleucine--tRNA ligase [Candidatus Acidifodinimicrobium mancum]
MGELAYTNKLEENINKRWKKQNIIVKIEKKNKQGEKFYFLDGPPFVTNEVHEGTLLGIFIKDAVTRYKLSRGFNVRLQPGWDTQGLPIEVAVEKRLGIKSKADILTLGESKFIEECRNFADEYIKLNTSIILDYGVLYFYNKPYKTYEDEYIQGVWSAMKNAFDKGLLYKGFKTTWFCVRCGTPMANYEVRDKYYNKEDPSVFVLFELSDGRHLLVWTTTPWTLPSNVAVAVNGKEKYIEVEVEGKRVILAKNRETILKETKKDYKIISEFYGSELVNLRYKHPFEDIPQVQKNKNNIGVVIDGGNFVQQNGIEFVSMEEGSGAVHMAPGHGESDYRLAIENKLPILSPVSDNGLYTDEAGWLNGKKILEVNSEIIDYLKNKGLLFHEGKIMHPYPHCWRCKTPLIQRASDQWFLAVSKIKESLIEISKGINWVPEISRESFEDWLKNAEDWVISRQRYWNTPLPIWVCDNCGNAIAVGNKKELMKLSGAKKINDLHKTSLYNIKIKCEKCGGEMHRVDDTVDVWLDSGSASFASLSYPDKTSDFERWFPVDFISEGNDQTRGWFYSLLTIGYIMTGKLSYKNVLMHKFVVGSNGMKLSKSEGNYKPVMDLLKEGYTRDSLRLSLLKGNLASEITFSEKELEASMRFLNIMFNLISLLKSFNSSKLSNSENKYIEDTWIMSRWGNTKKKVAESLDGYRTDIAMNLLTNFVQEDLSRTYVKLLKPRVFDENDLHGYRVFEGIFKELAVVSSIFLPYIGELMHGSISKKGSVILERFPSIDEKDLNEIVEKVMDNSLNLVQDILSLRETAKMNLRRPIKSISVIGLEKGEIFEDVVKRMANVMNISYALDEKDYEFKLNFDSKSPEFTQEEFAKAAARFLEITKESIGRKIKSGIEVDIDGKKYTINTGMISIALKKSNLISSNGFRSKSIIVADKDLDYETLREWIKREIIRVVQDARKQFGLERGDRIGLSIQIRGEEGARISSDISEVIASKTNASLSSKGNLVKTQDLSIGERDILIEIYKI